MLQILLRAAFVLLLLELCIAYTTVPNKELYDAGVKAYIYAYPLVLMDVTKQSSTAVSAPIEKSGRIQAPINQFANMASFPNAQFTDVVRPNADTLYSSAWLDLSKEPIILSVPDTHDRYYLMPMLSAWTNIFASPGKRTTGTTAQSFIIVGPEWHGTPPQNMTVIKAPTNMVWIIGHTQTNGPSDYDAVHQIQKEYKLIPLSYWDKNYIPPANVRIDQTIDVNTSPSKQVDQMSFATFFTRFAKILKNNPPQEQDAPMLAMLKALGIEPGKSFDQSKLTAVQLQTLTIAIAAAKKQITDGALKFGVHRNGWDYPAIVGTYGTNYMERATIAKAGLGANIIEDAIYPTTFVDLTGQPLNGKNRYVIHFDKNNIPPVNAFWSLAMYSKDNFFVPNAINRFSIGDRDTLQFNQDGSLNLYIQHDSPGKDKESNWLPAPENDFNLTMRLYWPKKNVLNGLWHAPPVIKVTN